MARINAKAPTYRDPCVEWLGQLSKAALIDCVVDLLRPFGKSVDITVTEREAIRRLVHVVEMRGDKVPLTQGRRLARHVSRLEMASARERVSSQLERQIAAAEAAAEA